MRNLTLFLCALIAVSFTNVSLVHARAGFVRGTLELFTTERVDLKQSASSTSSTVASIGQGEQIFAYYIEQGWAHVSFNDRHTGYIELRYVTINRQEIGPRPSPLNLESNLTRNDLIDRIAVPDPGALAAKAVRAQKVEFTDWSVVQELFTLNEPAEVFDVRTGKIYYVKSFSNGNHADVEPITILDTKAMFLTFGNQWSWDVRPVWVTINGRTFAGSINGQPHAQSTNDNNGMDGHICLHFRGSSVHGEASEEFGQLHQDVALEAFNTALNLR